MSDTLTRIGAYKLEEIAAAKAELSYADLEAAAKLASPVRGFGAALRKPQNRASYQR